MHSPESTSSRHSTLLTPKTPKTENKFRALREAQSILSNTDPKDFRSYYDTLTPLNAFREKHKRKKPSSSKRSQPTYKSIKSSITFNKRSTMEDASTLSSTSETNQLSSNFIIGKENWAEGIKCFICERGFSKLHGIFEHHCRRCGKAVCGNCSNNKKEDHRICDICIHKRDAEAKEREKENLLVLRQERHEACQEHLLSNEKRLEELIAKKNDRKWKTEQTKLGQDKEIKELEEEKERLDRDLLKGQEENKQLKEGIVDQARALVEKERKIGSLKRSILSLKEEIIGHKEVREAKQEELERLRKEKERYKKIEIDQNKMRENVDHVELNKKASKT